MNPAELRAVVTAIEGVQNIHDVHIRTVTSGLVAVSAHIEVTGSRDWHSLQPEEPHALPDAFRGCSLDSPEGRKACSVLQSEAAMQAHDHAH